jgi:hypothetical protein
LPLLNLDLSEIVAESQVYSSAIFRHLVIRMYVPEINLIGKSLCEENIIERKAQVKFIIHERFFDAEAYPPAPLEKTNATDPGAPVK